MPVEPYDEEEIAGSDKILRRISSQYIVPSENSGKQRLSSMAFSPSSGANGGMSVDIEKLISGAGISAREYVITPVFTGAVEFVASSARALSLKVGYEPLPHNPYHGEVWGEGAFKRSQKVGLRQACTWFVEIPGVDIGES